MSRFGKRGTVVDGMSDQPFSTSAEARRNRRHASWMLSLLLVPDGPSSSPSSLSAAGAGAAVTDGGSEDAANAAGRNGRLARSGWHTGDIVSEPSMIGKNTGIYRI